MFEYSLLHWTTFLTAALLLNLSPGPDIAFILSQTVRGGKRAGFASMFGIWTGTFGHVLLASAGLSAVIASSALAFSVVKWVGVAYLVWLGFSALRSDGGSFVSIGEPQKSNVFSIFKQGILVTLLNPKVAVFFLAFLPQFIVEGSGPIWAQLFLHGCAIVLVEALIEPPLILVGNGLSRKMRNNPRFGLWLDRSLGTIFVALGVRLAFQER